MVECVEDVIERFVHCDVFAIGRVPVLALPIPAEESDAQWANVVAVGAFTLGQQHKQNTTKQGKNASGAKAKSDCSSVKKGIGNTHSMPITNAQTHKCTNTELLKRSNAQLLKRSTTQMLTCTNAKVHK